MRRTRSFCCLALPATSEVTSRGNRQWKVRDKLFVWERPLRPRDLEELGNAAPDGPVVGARVPDEGATFALIAEEPDVYFTTAHFTGYPAWPRCRSRRELASGGGSGGPSTAPRALVAEHLPLSSADDGGLP